MSNTIYRTTDADSFAAVSRDLISPEATGFDPYRLVLTLSNYLITDGSDNYCLFESTGPGVFHGHYFVNNKRGREALSFCKEALDWFFTSVPEATVLVGAVGLENRKAIWMTRKLGFQSQGIISTGAGPMEIFTMTKEGYNNNG